MEVVFGVDEPHRRDHTWEIDFFRGGNEQLVITEIEFRYVRESFDRPPRLDIEVTGRPAVYNGLLARRLTACGRPPPKCPIAVGPAPRTTLPRANEAAGMAKTMTNAIATVTEVFDIANLHQHSLELRTR
jgi:hypothetical protein